MALAWLDMASVCRHIMVQDVFTVASDGVRMHNVSSCQSTRFTIVKEKSEVWRNKSHYQSIASLSFISRSFPSPSPFPSSDI